MVSLWKVFFGEDVGWLIVVVVWDNVFNFIFEYFWVDFVVGGNIEFYLYFGVENIDEVW